MRRLWWEDACAFFALICGVICLVSSWLHFELGKTGPLPSFLWPAVIWVIHLAGQPSVISFWIHALTYPSVVWFVAVTISGNFIQHFLQAGETQHLTVNLTHHVDIAQQASSNDFYCLPICLDVVLIINNVRDEICVRSSLLRRFESTRWGRIAVTGDIWATQYVFLDTRLLNPNLGHSRHFIWLSFGLSSNSFIAFNQIATLATTVNHCGIFLQYPCHCCFSFPGRVSAIRNFTLHHRGNWRSSMWSYRTKSLVLTLYLTGCMLLVCL